MTDLYAFLHPETPGQKEVVLSRFKKEDGSVDAFIIKPLTAEENDALIKRCTITTKDRGGERRRIDSTKYMKAIIVAATVHPDFRDERLCDAYGVVDPILVVGKMLLAGEQTKLADEILALSGLDEDTAAAEEEEAKN